MTLCDKRGRDPKFGDITLKKIVNDIHTKNVSEFNCPNENDGTTMPVINDIKGWIRSPWAQGV